MAVTCSIVKVLIEPYRNVNIVVSEAYEMRQVVINRTILVCKLATYVGESPSYSILIELQYKFM